LCSKAETAGTKGRKERDHHVNLLRLPLWHRGISPRSNMTKDLRRQQVTAIPLAFRPPVLSVPAGGCDVQGELAVRERYRLTNNPH
jgi:hypothetical protein